MNFEFKKQRRHQDNLPSVSMKINLPSFSVVATQVTQRRFAHTDVKIPDFGGYKKADKFKTEEGGREAGKVFTYLMIGGESKLLNSIFSSKTF